MVILNDFSLLFLYNSPNLTTFVRTLTFDAESYILQTYKKTNGKRSELLGN